MSMTKAILGLLLSAICVACAAEPADEDPPAEESVDAVEVALGPQYGSAYGSNCFCLSCITYCSVNGKTEKAGTCC